MNFLSSMFLCVRAAAMKDIKALFSLQNFWILAIVALLFLFDKHFPIME